MMFCEIDIDTHPRIVAEVAFQSVKSDVKNGVVGKWTHHATGKLLALRSVFKDEKIMGQANEAFFLTMDYSYRHHLQW